MTTDTNAREERVIVQGVDEETDELLGQLNYDPDSFVEGYLDDAEMTIIGIKFQKGGESRKNGRGEDFITRDQILVQYRVEDVEGIDTAAQYFALPPAFIAKDGSQRRREVTASSDYGVWLGQLAALGVSARADLGVRLTYGSLTDLVGLRIHREAQEVEGYQGQVRRIHLPTEILGMDNEVRKSNNLKAISLKDGGE